MSETKNDKIKAYTFHGLEIDKAPYNDKDHKGDCPICQKPRHFCVNGETGQYRCLKCEATGNIYTFLAILWESSYEATTEADYAQLGAARKLDPAALKDAHLAKSILTQEWIVPTYNHEGNITNLYKVVEEIVGGKAKHGDGISHKYRLYQTPSCKVGLFLVNLYLTTSPDTKLLRICEGLWDAIALWSATPPDNCLVLGVPGAGSFQPEWCEFPDGKHVELLYDNDHPQVYGADHEQAGQLILRKQKANSEPTHVRAGWDGMQRAVEVMSRSRDKRPASIKVLNWNKFQTPASLNKLPKGPRRDLFFPQPLGIMPYAEAGHHPDLPSGFDIRDLLTAVGPAATFTILPKLLDPVHLSSPEKPQASNGKAAPTPALAPIPCTTFKELCEHYRKYYHFTQNMEDTLAVMLAVILSTEAPVDQLWLRVIGPPGSGKSTLAEAVSAAKEYVSARSMVTGFHSGFVEYDKVTGDRREDAAPIKKLNNMTVVMKDADTLITSPNRDRIMGEMRDFFDRVSRAEYRNGVMYEIEDLNVTFIICGTDALRSLNRTFLGERFLDIEIMDDSTPKKEYLNRASANSYAQLTRFLSSPEKAEGSAEEQEVSREIRAATYGYIQHLRTSKHSIPLINTNTINQLEDLGQYLSCLRARKPKGDDLNYRPRAELATRLTAQFVKLAVYVAIAKQVSEADADTMRVVRKVVKDTAIGFQQEIVTRLAKEPLSRKTLCFDLGLPDTTVARLLYEMLEFNIVQRKSQNNTSGQRGRDVHLWELTPQMRALWLNAQQPVASVAVNGTTSHKPKPRKAKATSPKAKRKAKRS